MVSLRDDGSTWSATRRYRVDRGSDPIPAVRTELAAAWGEPATERRVRWPLVVHACRKPLSG